MVSNLILSEVKSEVIFGSLIFFTLRYIKGGVGANNNIGIKKCTTIFLWEWSSRQVGVLPEEFSKTPCAESFWKNGSQLQKFFSVQEGNFDFFWFEIFLLIFFSKKIYRDFSI